MTCIVGIKNPNNDGSVVIAGDSAGVNSALSLSVRADEKVFEVGPFIMGFTSSFRMGQLLRFSLKVPKQKKEQTDYEFMCTTFVDAVRKCWAEGGYLRKKEEREEGGCFLVGYNGELYEVESDFQVGQRLLPYAAVGCGEDLALGALYATFWMHEPETSYEELDLHEAATLALEAAAEFSAGVRAPFLVLEGGRGR